jgi:hypothetical protein
MRLPITNQALLKHGVDTPIPAKPSFVAPPPTLPSTNPSILVIEDNPDVVEFLTSCLQQDY